MKFKFATLFLFFFVVVCNSQIKNYSHYVNPFIGTGGAGHTFPGAVLPFGMVQLSPDTRIDGSWEGCSGYHYSDSVIYGFSHTHLSGTGVSDYCDVLMTPTNNEPNPLNKNTGSKFSHANEKAGAGYYSVIFNDSIKAELTTTTRVGIHRYTFPSAATGYVILDLVHRDKVITASIEVKDSITVTGKRISTGWAKEQHVYFEIKFSKSIKNLKEIIVDKKKNDTANKNVKEFFKFDMSDGKPLIAKVAISQTDNSGATKNMQAEAIHWNFEKYKLSAENSWNESLSKIEVKSEDVQKLNIFYTALYHSMIHPSVASDVDGRYRGRDMKIHQANGFVPYTVFSLWDSFRALHPLLSIIETKRTADFINSFTQQYAQSKRLPVWELSGNETNCMIGFHSVSVIADALAKNISGIDTTLIYQAVIDASNYTEGGLTQFNKKFYLEVNDESESVSKTLEYAYDNWCIARIALKYNNHADYLLYCKRANTYKNIFDTKTNFMRPKKNGSWLVPFEPREVNNYYTEANAWQYTFFVPHDINGLIRIMGGERKVESKLDELFNGSSQTVGREQVDITGQVGQYAHGNEPSHHMAYLYNYIGKPFKTQELTYKLLTNFYKNTPDGLIGNDDCGQLSAWYVLSSMGFYQVCPGLPDYTITAPLFDEVKIHIDKTHTFEIKKTNPKSTLQYIKSSTLNKNRNDASHFSHQQLLQGGELEFIMTDFRDSIGNFGGTPANRPHTYLPINNMVLSPTIVGSCELFSDTCIVSFEPTNEKTKIYYTLDGSQPGRRNQLYTGAFKVNKSLTIMAVAFLKTDSSSVTVSKLFKKPNNWTTQITSAYNSQYTAGGPQGLIDGRHGTVNWRSGEWQGYQAQNFECIIDLGELNAVESITSDYLQDVKAWIIYPKSVTYYTSENGKDFKLFGALENSIAADDYTVQMRSFTSNNTTKVNARYIKVKATNYGSLPAWHLGKGGEAFIFIDEIEIK